MTQASAIVKQGYRAGNLIAIGAPLTDDELTEGLDHLNGYLDSLMGFELGEYFTQWQVAPRNDAPTQERWPLWPSARQLSSSQYPYPPQNVRLLINVTADQTIWFPPHPNDGARISIVDMVSPTHTITLQGNGNLIDGAAVQTGTPSELDGKQYFYRADLGNWKPFTTLTATDEPILPPTYDRLLALGVLIRLAGAFGRDLSQTQQIELDRLTRRLKTQYKQSAPAAVDPHGVLTTPLSDPDRRSLLGGDFTS